MGRKKEERERPGYCASSVVGVGVQPSWNITFLWFIWFAKMFFVVLSLQYNRVDRLTSVIIPMAFSGAFICALVSALYMWDILGWRIAIISCSIAGDVFEWWTLLTALNHRILCMNVIFRAMVSRIWHMEPIRNENSFARIIVLSFDGGCNRIWHWIACMYHYIYLKRIMTKRVIKYERHLNALPEFREQNDDVCILWSTSACWLIWLFISLFIYTFFKNICYKNTRIEKLFQKH